MPDAAWVDGLQPSRVRDGWACGLDGSGPLSLRTAATTFVSTPESAPTASFRSRRRSPQFTATQATFSLSPFCPMTPVTLKLYYDNTKEDHLHMHRLVHRGHCHLVHSKHPRCLQACCLRPSSNDVPVPGGYGHCGDMARQVAEMSRPDHRNFSGTHHRRSSGVLGFTRESRTPIGRHG